MQALAPVKAGQQMTSCVVDSGSFAPSRLSSPRMGSSSDAAICTPAATNLRSDGSRWRGMDEHVQTAGSCRVINGSRLGSTLESAFASATGPCTAGLRSQRRRALQPDDSTGHDGSSTAADPHPRKHPRLTCDDRDTTDSPLARQGSTGVADASGAVDESTHSARPDAMPRPSAPDACPDACPVNERPALQPTLCAHASAAAQPDDAAAPVERSGSVAWERAPQSAPWQSEEAAAPELQASQSKASTAAKSIREQQCALAFFRALKCWACEPLRVQRTRSHVQCKPSCTPVVQSRACWVCERCACIGSENAARGASQGKMP